MTHTTEKEPVVMITLRVPVWLHAAVEEAAHDNRTSINMYCRRVLEKSVGHVPDDSDPFAVRKTESADSH